jgi:hypothetical protein
MPMTLDEAQKLEEVTSAIVANLRFIEEHCPSTENLAQLNEETSEIAANLKFIEEHE